MSERIYSALTEDMVRRMRNWVRWKSGTSIGITGLRYVADRYHEAAIPILLGEGEDTDNALHALAPKYRQVVERFWMHEGASLRHHARWRGIAPATFETWVIEGHERLKSILAVQAEALRQRYASARYLH